MFHSRLGDIFGAGRQGIVFAVERALAFDFSELPVVRSEGIIVVDVRQWAEACGLCGTFYWTVDEQIKCTRHVWTAVTRIVTFSEHKVALRIFWPFKDPYLSLTIYMYLNAHSDCIHLYMFCC